MYQISVHFQNQIPPKSNIPTSSCVKISNPAKSPCQDQDSEVQVPCSFEEIKKIRKLRSKSRMFSKGCRIEHRPLEGGRGALTPLPCCNSVCYCSEVGVRWTSVNQGGIWVSVSNTFRLYSGFWVSSARQYREL